jgi:hypothetical protein
MKTFIASTGRQRISTSWYHALSWACEKVRVDADNIVKIYIARPGDKRARVVAEVTHEGIRQIEKGRLVDLKKLEVVTDG